MATIDREKLSEYLSAYLDDELTDAERQAVERLVARDALARTELDGLRQTVELVRSLPRRTAPPSLLEDLTAVAEREQLLGEPGEESRPRRPWWVAVRPVLSVAAVLAITIGGGLVVYHNMYAPELPGELADAGPMAMDLAEKEDRAPSPRSESTEESLAKADVSPDDLRSAGRMDLTELDAPAPTVAGRTGGTDAYGGAAGSANEETAAAPAKPVIARADAAAPVESRLRRLTAGLNLEQKNEANLAGEILARHQFANESNQFTVVVADRQDEARARAQLVEFAVRNKLRPVHAGPAMPALSNSMAIVMEGRPGYNYDADQPAQTLVRLPAGKLPRLLEAVGYGDGGPRPTRLAVGPVVVDGLDESRKLVRHMRRRAPIPPNARGDLPASSSRRHGEETEGALPDDEFGRARPSAIGNMVALRAIEPGREARAKRSPAATGTAPEKKTEALRYLFPSASSPPSDREAAAGPAEPNQDVVGVLLRLLGGGADKRKGAGGRPHLTPGRLVDRNERHLKLRGATGAGGLPSPDRDAEPAGEDALDDRLITVVVQFLRQPEWAVPASQPADRPIAAP